MEESCGTKVEALLLASIISDAEAEVSDPVEGASRYKRLEAALPFEAGVFCCKSHQASVDEAAEAVESCGVRLRLFLQQWAAK